MVDVNSSPERFPKNPTHQNSGYGVVVMVTFTTLYS